MMNGNDGIGSKGGIVPPPPPPPLPESAKQESNSSSARIKETLAKRYVGIGKGANTLSDEISQKAKSISERQISESDSGIGSSTTEDVANLSELESETGLLYKSAIDSLEQVGKCLSAVKKAYIRDSLISFEKIERNREAIKDSLESKELSNGEKCKFFKSHSNGVLVHVGETPVDLIIKGCDDLPQSFFNLMSDPEIDNVEVFNRFFNDGAICFEARYSTAQQYMLELIQPKSSKNPYDNIAFSSSDSVNDILYEHLRVFSESNTDLDFAEFKSFVSNSPILKGGFRASDGEINRESINNFLQNELGFVE